MKQQAMSFYIENNIRTIIDLTRYEHKYIDAALLVDEHDVDAKPENQKSLIPIYSLS